MTICRKFRVRRLKQALNNLRLTILHTLTQLLVLRDYFIFLRMEDHQIKQSYRLKTNTTHTPPTKMKKTHHLNKLTLVYLKDFHTGEQLSDTNTEVKEKVETFFVILRGKYLLTNGEQLIFHGQQEAIFQYVN